MRIVVVVVVSFIICKRKQNMYMFVYIFKLITKLTKQRISDNNSCYIELYIHYKRLYNAVLDKNFPRE